MDLALRMHSKGTMHRLDRKRNFWILKFQRKHQQNVEITTLSTFLQFSLHHQDHQGWRYSQSSCTTSPSIAAIFSSTATGLPCITFCYAMTASHEQNDHTMPWAVIAQYIKQYNEVMYNIFCCRIIFDPISCFNNYLLLNWALCLKLLLLC